MKKKKKIPFRHVDPVSVLLFKQKFYSIPNRTEKKKPITARYYK